ncbi:hypothetical protein ACO0QE_003123 [Hanseniaspora vineae]
MTRPSTRETTPLLHGQRTKQSPTPPSFTKSQSYSALPGSQKTTTCKPNNNIVRSSTVFPQNEKLSIRQRLPYYIPILHWAPQYNALKFSKDLLAGISLASFQIPLAISFATTMAHVSPLSGLLSLSFTPIVYCIIGSINQMIVGPESAISLIVGQTIDHMVKTHPKDAKHMLNPLLITAALTFISGLTLFISGIFRLGFLDNILSRVLLMGFISGVGSTMIITAFITQCKMDQWYADCPEHYHSTFDKILFLIKYCKLDTIHYPTFIFSAASCFLLFFIKFWKKRHSHKNHSNWIFFVPEILLVTILATVISRYFNLPEKYDILLVSSMFSPNEKAVFASSSTTGKSTPVHIMKHLKNSLWMPPFKTMLKYRYELLHPGMTLAMLGFFESSTASKALGSTYDLELSSSNRELIALGSMNLVGSVFGGSLPSFGGYGRSRINAMSGAQTTVSGLIMGLTTFLITTFGFQLIGYIPLCLLSCVSTLIGYTLLEECPSLLSFHFRCGGYMELFLFFVVSLTTIFHSLETGITVGIVFSLIIVVKNSTKSRIQILGRLSGSNVFVNANDIKNTRPTDMASTSESLGHWDAEANRIEEETEEDGEADEADFFPVSYSHSHTVEEIEGCLIVKISEPLVFTNTSDMKSRLKRLEKFGSSNQHPAAPRSREASMTRFIIFDVNGMTAIDSSAALVFHDLIEMYVKSGTKILLVAHFVPIKVKNILSNSRILELVEYDELNKQLGDVFFKTIQDALHLVDFIEACGEAEPMRRRSTEESIPPSILNNFV